MKLLQDNIEDIKEVISLEIEPLLDDPGEDAYDELTVAFAKIYDLLDGSISHIEEIRTEEDK